MLSGRLRSTLDGFSSICVGPNTGLLLAIEVTVSGAAPVLRMVNDKSRVCARRRSPKLSAGGVTSITGATPVPVKETSTRLRLGSLLLNESAPAFAPVESGAKLTPRVVLPPGTRPNELVGRAR